MPLRHPIAAKLDLLADTLPPTRYVRCSRRTLESIPRHIRAPGQRPPAPALSLFGVPVVIDEAVCYGKFVFHS